MTTAASPAARLLHNMSAPSKSVINHTGRPCGRRLRFRLSASSTSNDLLSDLLHVMGGQSTGLTEAEIRRRLAACIDQHARGLALPPAAAVAPEREHGTTPKVCRDQRDAITVLAKSSEHVYLRDKAPILERLIPGRQVVLILPRTWSKA